MSNERQKEIHFVFPEADMVEVPTSYDDRETIANWYRRILKDEFFLSG